MMFYKERDMAIYEARQQGKTLPALAMEYGLTKEAIRLACIRIDNYLKEVERVGEHTANLSVRARRVLKDVYGVERIEDAPEINTDILNDRSIGLYTYKQLFEARKNAQTAQ